MATIKKRQKKDGTFSFTVRVRVPKQPLMTKTFSSKKDAAEWGVIAEKQLKGLHGAAPSRKQFDAETFVTAAAKYTNDRALSNEAKSALRCVSRNIGSQAMSKIDAAFISAYCTKLRGMNTRRGAPYTEETIKKHFNAIKSVVLSCGRRYQVSMPELIFAPADPNYQYEQARDRRLVANEETLLRDSAARRRRDGPEWICLITFALETGGRLQELVGAQWNEIDLEGDNWAIPKRRTKTKTDRNVPLSQKARRALSEQRERQPAGETRVFPNFEPAKSSVAFHSIAKKAGVVNFTFHDFRHEAISRMVLTQKNLSLAEIMSISGHKTMSSFQRYVNLRGSEFKGRWIG